MAQDRSKRIPGEDKQLARAALRAGLIDREALQRLVQRQKQIKDDGDPVPSLAQLLVREGGVDVAQVKQVLLQARRAATQAIQQAKVEKARQAETDQEMNDAPTSMEHAPPMPRPLVAPDQTAAHSSEAETQVPVPDTGGRTRRASTVPPTQVDPPDVVATRPAPEAGLEDLDDAPTSLSEGPPVVSTSRGLGRQGTLGKYTIVREVARGGVGAVYEAEADGTTVALKVLLDTSGHPEHVLRLRQEGELAAQLHHPGIVEILDVGEARAEPDEAPVHYIAMEFIRGTTLTTASADMSLDRRIEVIAQVAEAIGFAHEKAIIHRDLKPANIMIRECGRVVVTDFGLARIDDDRTQLTRTGAVMGTAFYMSPEQCRGHRAAIDAKSDVWALGVILYEMLTDRRPFVGETSAEILLQVLEREPTPPRKLRREVPAPLETICLKALERDRRRRYESATEIARELRRWQGGQSITTRAPTISRRVLKRIDRQPWFVGGGLLAALALIPILLGVALPTLERSARVALLREVHSQIQAKIEVLFGEAQTSIKRLRRKASEGHLDLDRSPHRHATSEGDRLALYLADQLVDLERFSWVSYSGPEGDFVGAYRAPARPEIWINRSYLGGGTTHTHQFRFARGRLEPAVNPPSPGAPDYDPRTRPFYALAAAAPELAWTPPYVFWEGYPGITCAAAVRREGTLAGVLTVDFEIWQLSKQLRRMTIGQSGQRFGGTVVLLSTDGKVVAHSREEIIDSPDKLTRKQGGSLALVEAAAFEADPLVKAFAARLDVDGPVELEHDGVTYVGSRQRRELAGLKLVAAAIVAADDPQIRRPLAGRLRIIGWATWLLALVGACWLGWRRWQAHRRALADAA